jgi:hypothetical protein
MNPLERRTHFPILPLSTFNDEMGKSTTVMKGAWAGPVTSKTGEEAEEKGKGRNRKWRWGRGSERTGSDMSEPH